MCDYLFCDEEETVTLEYAEIELGADEKIVLQCCEQHGNELAMELADAGWIVFFPPN